MYTCVSLIILHLTRPSRDVFSLKYIIWISWVNRLSRFETTVGTIDGIFALWSFRAQLEGETVMLNFSIMNMLGEQGFHKTFSVKKTNDVASLIDPIVVLLKSNRPQKF